MPSERKKLVKQLDDVFAHSVKRVAIKRYKKCPFCKTKPITNCFHFVTRKKYSVRWDMSNATGSCYGCNFNMEFDPHPYIVWYIKEYGLEAYLGLVERARMSTKLSDLALKAMITHYEQIQ